MGGWVGGWLSKSIGEERERALFLVSAHPPTHPPTHPYLVMNEELDGPSDKGKTQDAEEEGEVGEWLAHHVEPSGKVAVWVGGWVVRGDAYGWEDGCVNEWMNERVNESMDEWMNE